MFCHVAGVFCTVILLNLFNVTYSGITLAGRVVGQLMRKKIMERERPKRRDMVFFFLQSLGLASLEGNFSLNEGSKSVQENVD